MFKVWNIIDSALDRRSGGHHYFETRAVSDELVRRGQEVRIFSCKDAPIGRFPGAKVVPTFSLHRFTNLSNDPSWSQTENFIFHNRAFEQDLMRAGGEPFGGTLTFFPTIDMVHFLGLTRWLKRLDARARPKSAIILFPLLRGWSLSNINAQYYRKIWQECPAELKADIALCVREKATAEHFEQLLGTRPAYLPTPLGPYEKRGMPLPNEAPADGPMLVSFLGGARPDRGAYLLSDIVRKCASFGIRFFIQTKTEDVTNPVLNVPALKGLPNVDVHEGMLDRDAYYDIMARSLVMLPCMPGAYDDKSSGVYLEAKFVGAPVIVPDASWMAKDVRENGNGLTFEEHSADAIAECLRRARAKWPALRAAAVRHAREFAEWNGADRMIDVIEALFRERSA